MEKLLTIQQLSELIQVSPKTIYQWTHIGYVPYYKLPKGIRFRQQEVEIWLKRKKKGGRFRYKVEVV